MREFLTSRRPTPAMAVAFVALLAALSGTAVALPGTNSVDSGDIKNNAVKTKDIKNNDVRSKDIRNSALTGGDVKNDALTGSDINEGTLGQVPSANTANTANSATTRHMPTRPERWSAGDLAGPQTDARTRRNAGTSISGLVWTRQRRAGGAFWFTTRRTFSQDVSSCAWTGSTSPISALGR